MTPPAASLAAPAEAEVAAAAEGEREGEVGGAGGEEGRGAAPGRSGDVGGEGAAGGAAVPGGGCRRAWRADRGDARERLDVALVRHLAGVPGATRSRVQDWIDAGRVRVNGRAAARSAARLAMGDAVEVELPAPPPVHAPPAPQRLPLAILYEDQHLLALNKPPGLLVHPAGRHRDGTLVNAVAWHLARELPEGEGAGARAGAEPLRPGLVNRLDRDTSGVLLVAKTRAAHAGLARAIAARALGKDYLAVTYGRAPMTRGRIDLPLRRDPEDRRRVIAAERGGSGLSAVTLYELLGEAGAGVLGGVGGGGLGVAWAGGGVGDAGAVSGSDAGAGGCVGSAEIGGGVGEGRRDVWLSLVGCRLVTGRTHQIRVHLAAIGMPIVGDPVYGEPRHRGIADPVLAALCRGFGRQALHAWRLALRHPVTRQALVFEAPLPDDLAALVAAAGGAVWQAALRR